MWTQPQAKSAKSLPPPPPAPSLCGDGGCQVKRSQPHPILICPRSLDEAFLSGVLPWPTGRPLAVRDPCGDWRLSRHGSCQQTSGAAGLAWHVWTGPHTPPWSPGTVPFCLGPRAPGRWTLCPWGMGPRPKSESTFLWGSEFFVLPRRYTQISSTSYGRSTVYNSILQSCC